MPKSPRTAHVYLDGNVTPARVRGFAEAPPDVQLEALTDLRKRTVDAAAFRFGVMGISFALLLGLGAILFDSAPLLFEGDDYVVLQGFTAEQSALIGVLFGLVVISFFLWLLMRLGLSVEESAANATALLRAYEAELVQRRAAKGRDARRWQRAHGVEWGVPGR